jgi:hypothetical protein
VVSKAVPSVEAGYLHASELFDAPNQVELAADLVPVQALWVKKVFVAFMQNS